jgi:fumarate reductase subunit C
MSGAHRETWLWLLQRGSAVAMLPLLGAHLILMLLVAREGLSAPEILGRTHGNVPLAAFYGFLVLFASVHAALGLRTLLAESFAWRGSRLDGTAAAFTIILLVMGGRATWAIYSVSA